MERRVRAFNAAKKHVFFSGASTLPNTLRSHFSPFLSVARQEKHATTQKNATKAFAFAKSSPARCVLWFVVGARRRRLGRRLQAAASARLCAAAHRRPPHQPPRPPPTAIVLRPS
jgi:hypothetical protein